MFKKIYRALVIAKTQDAAQQLLNNCSDRMLADIGIERATFVEEMVARAEAEFAASDKAKSLPIMNPLWADAA